VAVVQARRHRVDAACDRRARFVHRERMTPVATQVIAASHRRHLNSDPPCGRQVPMGILDRTGVDLREVASRPI
jgi:hypothetical protein